jgi:hypothetical protein
MSVGHPAYAADIDQAQVVTDNRASNPLVIFHVRPVPGINIAPSIHYGGNVFYTRSTGDLRFQGFVGIFPAFEAYAQLNDGPITAIFKQQPAPGTTVNSISYAGATAVDGVGQQAIDVTIRMPGISTLKGQWSGTYSMSIYPRGSAPITATFSSNSTATFDLTFNFFQPVHHTMLQIQHLSISAGGAAAADVPPAQKLSGTFSADKHTFTGTIGPNDNPSNIKFTLQKQ